MLGCQDTSCYHFFSSSRTWNESRSECIKIGGDLAVIDDEVTHNFVSSKLFELLKNGETAATEVWLGAKGVELDNWYWDDGSVLGTFTRWTTGYPQNNMYVAQYNDTGYHWKDQISAYPYRYICDGNTELCSKPLPVDHVKISPTLPRQCLLAYVGGSTRSWHNLNRNVQILVQH
ncbi:hypothetical protein LSH36_644g01020 [Paralvinella palmiformis]|uniref:C-type lectin domain-containing protein n=1 Tax=Paralvinella palmiformis TaxID=53620 RepID=A0AAD9J3I7_9ANNE|nr:hypothetical protein LSH36_644g01020 [Paralvinella palmiformis]